MDVEGGEGRSLVRGWVFLTVCRSDWWMWMVGKVNH